MSPLRSLANEIHAIERGESSEIAGTYPSELMPLADNLNAMIRTGYAQMARYRNALGDLAHSLKTPLAVLRGVSEDPALPPRWREALADPLQRIQQLGDQELRRAATAGRRVMAEPLLLRPLGDRILEAMAKVHVERHLRLLNLVDPRLRARVDASDLYDVLGNLLDNACKWASTQVRLSASQSTSELLLEVEDDGPGFPPQAERLLERGVRADTRVSGQGIGLATVSDIVSLSEGRLELGTSPLGGARVRVLLPR
jgi:Signal transduction histidine kinase